MPLPFLQRSHAYAARLLHQAGLKISEIPAAIDIARTTVETWFEREISTEHNQQVLSVLKGQVQEKGPKLLYDQLKELVLVKLIIHLGIRSALASNIATLLLPFVLKRVYEKVKKNDKVQTWWGEQNWKQRLPTTGGIKNRLTEVQNSLRPNQSPKDQALFV